VAELKKQLQERLAQLKLTQAQMAALVGVTPSDVSAWKTGAMADGTNSAQRLSGLIAHWLAQPYFAASERPALASLGLPPVQQRSRAAARPAAAAAVGARKGDKEDRPQAPPVRSGRRRQPSAWLPRAGTSSAVAQLQRALCLVATPAFCAALLPMLGGIEARLVQVLGMREAQRKKT
jgi:transcriptional regulator with XRE-family HTH domain